MRCIGYFFLPTLLAFVCSGCSGGGGEVGPSAKLSGIRFGDLHHAALELTFDIEIRNPYLAELPLTSMTYSLSAKKEKIVTGSANPNTTIAPGAKEKISLPVRVHYGHILRKLKNVEPGSRIRYEAELLLSADTETLGEIDVPIKKSGKVTLPYVNGVTYKRILELRDFE